MNFLFTEAGTRKFPAEYLLGSGFWKAPGSFASVFENDSTMDVLLGSFQKF